MVMIPADLASAQLKLIADLVGKPQPVSATQKSADVLRDLVPGQRFTATIQALLPDGNYRASIAGQSLTLSLPFAAQAGESLELETVEQNGKMTLAVATNRGSAEVAGKEAARAETAASTATRLTPTGRLIAELLAGIDKEGGKRPQPASLNNAQPIFERLPGKTTDIAAALRTALGRSGMFYEAHQARWVQGQTTLTSLLSEPQGRLSPAAHALGTPGEPAGAARGIVASQPQNPAQNPPPSGIQASAQTRPGAAPATSPTAPAPQASPQNPSAASATSTSGVMAESSAVRVGMGHAIAPDLAPLVRQQLEALASNTYVWQGQIWSGQTLNWEIIEEDSEQRQREENIAPNWTTRLNLKLPNLGALEATLRLSGGRNIQIFLRTENDAARARLIAANADLRRRFETSGLALEFLDVLRHVRDK